MEGFPVFSNIFTFFLYQFTDNMNIATLLHSVYFVFMLSFCFLLVNTSNLNFSRYFDRFSLHIPFCRGRISKNPDEKIVAIDTDSEHDYSTDNEDEDAEFTSGEDHEKKTDESMRKLDEQPPTYEILLDYNDSGRFILFPLEFHDVFEFYKLQVAQFWTTEEVDLSKDVDDWKKLDDHERKFFEHILAFFAPSDGIVSENLVVRFYEEIQVPEVRLNYVFQAAMENIHAEMYSLLITTLIPDESRQKELFFAFENFPGVRQKVEWVKKWLTSTASFSTRLVAFAVVEGLLFSGSFASIFWLKKRGLMPGTTFSNELISRDEGLHCNFAVLLYRKYVAERLSVEKLYAMIDDAVDTERVFFEHALQQPVGELNSESMLTYVKFCADRLLVELGVSKLYNCGNPFEFMHRISIDGKSNFFERRVGDYRKSKVANPTNNLDNEMFYLDNDF